MRTLVVGDIHGGLKALKQVFERAGVGENDQLIFLGDYVDGWSEAYATVNFLIGLKAEQDCVFLKGNHDELFLDWLLTAKDNPMWLASGGEATLDSYKDIEGGVLEVHKHFLQNLEDYYLDTEKRLFLHAGFTNVNGVNHEYFSKMFYWDRTLWETALALDPDLSPESDKYPKRFKHYKEIYIGHTPVTRIGKTKPVKAANVWNVDTGAALKGPLSIMDVNTKELWQSDPAYLLYPNEKGRN